MKICRMCKQELPGGDFYRDSQRLDGLGSYCKQCHLRRMKERLDNEMKCGNCAATGCYAKGLCRTCYAYKNRTGKDRVPKKSGHSCVNCDRPIDTPYVERCQSCHLHLKKRGEERPKKPPNMRTPYNCSNCGVWCTSGEAAKGACRRCYNYQLKLGRARPKHLWEAVQ